MRNAHYWKKAAASGSPGNIIVFDCETHFGTSAAVAGGEHQTLRLGVALAYRLERGRRTRVQRIIFRSAGGFWALVRERLHKRIPLWVFAHNIPYDLGCVGGWGWLSKSGYETQKAAVSGTLFYLKGRWLNCGLIFADTCNYYKCSLKALGKSVGLPKMELPDHDDADCVWERYCSNDVDVTALGLDKLIQFNREHGLGPWQPSIAGLSFSAYRSCFMRDKVLVHPYPRVLAMERAAYFGGIVDTPKVGVRIPGPVYELDVCSMYPHCCTMDLPVKFRHDGSRYGVRAIETLARDHIVFADVEIDSPTEPFPVKLKRGAYYPVGRFRTCLAHPELMYAIQRGYVKYVHHASYYTRAPLFRSYMDWFVQRKIDYERKGDDAFRTICKYFANSLYGKTGQMTPKWREWCEESLRHLEEIEGLKPESLAEWYAKPPTLYLSEETFRFPCIPHPVAVRDMYGVVELKTGESESRDSCPAIAATVTSYARLLLRGYQRTAGDGHWFYSDTDSIWVDQIGRERLQEAGAVKPDTLGYLAEKSVHEWMIVHGPKDYETDQTTKMKGVRSNAERTDDGGFRQMMFPGALVQMRDGIQNGVYVRYVTKHLKRQLTRCILMADGVTRPLRFPAENPELRVKRKRRDKS